MLYMCYKNTKSRLLELIEQTGSVQILENASNPDRSSAILHYIGSQPLLTATCCFKPLAVGVDSGAIF